MGNNNKTIIHDEVVIVDSEHGPFSYVEDNGKSTQCARCPFIHTDTCDNDVCDTLDIADALDLDHFGSTVYTQKIDELPKEEEPC